MEVNTSLRLRNVGPISDAAVTFGDLTVLVGPQASGKSIFLQLLKLVCDSRSVVEKMRHYGLNWTTAHASFFDAYLGEGMASVWTDESSLSVDGEEVSLRSLTGLYDKDPEERLFYVPAQRVLTLSRGWPRPFYDYSASDPFVVRAFSHASLELLEDDLLRASGTIYPKPGRIKSEVRKGISDHIYRGLSIESEQTGPQRRLVLRTTADGASLPAMTWSAGQREFLPLLLGLYRLMPAGKVPRRAGLQWAVIEEPENGLHPRAVAAVLLAVVDLLSRGYRVCLSTHSSEVLDLVWALRVVRETSRKPDHVRELFGLRKTGPAAALAKAALDKSMRVYSFDPSSGLAANISRLDPDSVNDTEALWGGMTEFASRASEVVAAAVNDADDEWE